MDTHHPSPPPDLDAIARNLSYLDLAHLTPEESTAHEHELSVLASLNDALETATAALQGNNPQFWQQLHPLLSDAAALLSSQLAPLLDPQRRTQLPHNRTAHRKAARPRRPAIALTLISRCRSTDTTRHASIPHLLPCPTHPTATPKSPKSPPP